MRKAVEIVLFLLVVFVFDRFLFLPGRMNGTWDYKTGTNIGDSITFENIDIVNNFEVKISNSKKLDSFYLLGCYFGTLYLLDKDTLEYTVYEEYESLEME
ncbi:hypothetical protein [Flavobacterium sp.]|uniref:hypothetical protein n=1 Tax=Flavobacterium sp. TaxID=239 RepID=UPI00391A14E6